MCLLSIFFLLKRKNIFFYEILNTERWGDREVYGKRELVGDWESLSTTYNRSPSTTSERAQQLHQLIQRIQEGGQRQIVSQNDGISLFLYSLLSSLLSPLFSSPLFPLLSKSTFSHLLVLSFAFVSSSTVYAFGQSQGSLIPHLYDSDVLFTTGRFAENGTGVLRGAGARYRWPSRGEADTFQIDLRADLAHSAEDVAIARRDAHSVWRLGGGARFFFR